MGLVVLPPVMYLVVYAIYNLFINPLKTYPGPTFNAISRIPYALMLARGNSSRDIMAMHDKYGDVVRVAPDELAFADPRAWKDIFSQRNGDIEKHNTDLTKLFDAPNIIDGNREDHRRFRRVLSQGFSAQAMLDQQPSIVKYVDLLISRLTELCPRGPVDMVAWYNFTTFDIIGDLTCGEPFGCLQSGVYHPWIATIFSSIKVGTMVDAISYFPWIKALLMSMVPKSALKKRDEIKTYTQLTVQKRLALGPTRPDFMQGIIQRKGETALTVPEIESNAMILISAGSETIATALSGATYHVLSNPEVYIKVRDEVRKTFSSSDEIDLHSTAKLTYTAAVIEETLRIYPPVPTSALRKIGPTGHSICGEHVPPNTKVGLWQYAIYHNPRFFKHPKRFAPERWLGDPEYTDDVKEHLNPFHLGPRDCIGKNLAYAEMRLIFAKLIYNFDMELDPVSKDWADQKMYLFWEKGELKVRLTPAPR
ncbi:Isotrichodermin C-15 hydroxylase [Sphaceloma murrayae]|uniref:Isotrichodermin C-15 hydroxylase n=1 Tax=Sphaceloma murrayae TaxID=2082308 RepID=A0A2K1QRN9_9PEZI|nr:Isotrichodermin C-15 hydroxylase [Sphaceloma murrayae]